MAQAAWSKGLSLSPVCFDMSFRKVPFGGGFVVWAGVEDLVAALEYFRFGEEERAFLLENGFGPQFVAFLEGWQFTGSIWSVPEGEVVFPHEPLVRVEGNWIEASVIETILLHVLNFQSLIATKAARIRRVAGERHVSEFGLRRAPGGGGLAASRGAFIGGCDSTSNLEAARRYGIPSVGTMSDIFGVGTRLVTGDPEGAPDGVYNLCEADGEPRMKRSDSLSKSSLPGRKTVTRFYDEENRPVADAVHLADEPPPSRIIHPIERQSSFDVSPFRGEPLLQALVLRGRHLAASGTSAAVERARRSLERLPAEHQRFESPHVYKVGLSAALADLRDRLCGPGPIREM